MSKVAVVTGGASGIGHATIKHLLADDWHVWSLDRSEHNLAKQAAELGVGDRYQSSICDVSQPESVVQTFDRIAHCTDRIRALVCSAGVAMIGPLESIPIVEVDTMIGVNIKGPWLSIRGALPLLRKDATVADPARVVIIGSIAGMRPKVGNGMYSATKVAIHALSGVFAVELASYGITVNTVAPGTVNTPMVETIRNKMSDKTRFDFSGMSPLGRIAEPNDVADVVMFLLSNAAKFINGAVLPVDGGTRAAFVKT